MEGQKEGQLLGELDFFFAQLFFRCFLFLGHGAETLIRLDLDVNHGCD